MTLAFGELIRAAVEAGSQVHIWPAHFGGGIDASVRSQGGAYHVSLGGTDPVATLTAALIEEDRQRRDGSRIAGQARNGPQHDIEDAIAADGDDFEALL